MILLQLGKLKSPSKRQNTDRSIDFVLICNFFWYGDTAVAYSYYTYLENTSKLMNMNKILWIKSDSITRVYLSIKNSIENGSFFPS